MSARVRIPDLASAQKYPSKIMPIQPFVQLAGGRTVRSEKPPTTLFLICILGFDMESVDEAMEYGGEQHARGADYRHATV